MAFPIIILAAAAASALYGARKGKLALCQILGR